jgi:hypothetical protein
VITTVGVAGWNRGIVVCRARIFDAGRRVRSIDHIRDRVVVADRGAYVRVEPAQRVDLIRLGKASLRRVDERWFVKR